MNRIGVDEAGKGDYFGYLVIAGVFVDDRTEKQLRALGVKDSKRLSDNRVLRLSQEIKKLCKYDIVRISPETYNKIYNKFESLNKLLAWGHARAIENLSKRVKCGLAISDKFADEKILKDSLLQNGRKMQLVQKINAEQDLAVAAASVLARAEFLRTLERLGKEIGCNLPKGARVDDIAKDLVKRQGVNILFRVAKIHFKITKRILKEEK